MIFGELKQACLDAHLQIKGGAYATRIMEHSLSLQGYRTLLQANFVFHCTIENQLVSVLLPGQQADLQLARRRKIHHILSDLQALGDSPVHMLPPVSYQIQSFFQALGALYVTEGTAIGGAIIRKNLLKNPNIAPVAQIHFYGCYGDQLSPLWKSFAEYLNGFAGNPVAVKEMIFQARESFLLYEQCIAMAERYQDTLHPPALA